MRGEIGAALVQGEQLLLVKVAAVGQRRIDSRAGMALGADKAVAAFHLRIGRVDVHFFKIQDSKCFHNGQAAADVADTQVSDAGHDITADIFADFFQIVAQWNFLLLDVSSYIIDDSGNAVEAEFD